MRYIAARLSQSRRELVYRSYISDALKLIAENTKNFGGGAAPDRRYWDILQDISREEPADDRTEEEVIAHVLGALEKVRDGGD